MRFLAPLAAILLLPLAAPTASAACTEPSVGGVLRVNLCDGAGGTPVAAGASTYGINVLAVAGVHPSTPFVSVGASASVLVESASVWVLCHGPGGTPCGTVHAQGAVTGALHRVHVWVNPWPASGTAGVVCVLATAPPGLVVNDCPVEHA